jgi:hypothetical protein
MHDDDAVRDDQPFAISSWPAPDLKSAEWAKNYNEIKELGEKNSGKRTPRQTEDARFWLTTGPLATHPLEQQIVIGKGMSVLSNVRFMALSSVVETGTVRAVCEAMGRVCNRSPPPIRRSIKASTQPRSARGPGRIAAFAAGSRVLAAWKSEPMRIRTRTTVTQWIDTAVLI